MSYCGHVGGHSFGGGGGSGSSRKDCTVCRNSACTIVEHAMSMSAPRAAMKRSFFTSSLLGS